MVDVVVAADLICQLSVLNLSQITLQIFVSTVLIHPINQMSLLFHMIQQHISHCSILLVTLSQHRKHMGQSYQKNQSYQGIPSAMVTNSSAQENGNSTWIQYSGASFPVTSNS